MKPASADSKTPAPGSPSSRETPAPGLDEGDVSLIRWMLEMTPTERLERARDFLEGALALRHGRKVAR